MTVVIAKQFGERIITMWDSMISDASERGPDIFPARLKAIVVSERLTIFYCGLSNLAVATIRAIAKDVRELSLDDILDWLASESKSHIGEIDFYCRFPLPQSAPHQGSQRRLGGR